MKYIKVILKILLIVLLIAEIMSFIIENMVIKTFSQEILSKKVSGYFLDEIIYDVNVDELSKIENNIRSSKHMEKITSEFINVTIKNIVYNKNETIDITNEIDSLIAKNISNKISKEKSANIKDYITEKTTDIQKKLEDNLLDSFGNEYLNVLKTYNIFTNIYFRIIILLLLIIDITFLVILEKFKVLNFIKIATLIVAIFSLVIFILIKFMSNIIDQNLAGGFLQSINASSLIIGIIIELIIYFILNIIDKKLKVKI